MILIDVDMPYSCLTCPLLTEGMTCKITSTPIWQSGIDCKADRLPDCPIIECNFDMSKIKQAMNAMPIVPIPFKIIE